MKAIRKILGTGFLAFSSLGSPYQPAYAIDGTASGVAKETWSFMWCGGRNHRTFTFNNFVMYSSGTWFIDAPSGTYSGTWVDAKPSKPDRTFKLTFDTESLTLLHSSLGIEASGLCAYGIPASFETSYFTAKMNKAQTKVAVKLIVLTIGTNTRYVGKGKYSLRFKADFQSN